MSILLAALILHQASSIEVPFRTLSFGKNPQIKDGGAVVMRSSDSYDAYRKLMNTTEGKKPVVDWGKEQIVALHAVGIMGYGPSSIHVVKVLKAPNGSLEINAALDAGNRPATPTPGVVKVLKKEGIYTLIVVPVSKGEVKLRLVDPPASSGDRSGTPG